MWKVSFLYKKQVRLGANRVPYFSSVFPKHYNAYRRVTTILLIVLCSCESWPLIHREQERFGVKMTVCGVVAPSLITLMMEAAGTSETLVNFYRITRLSNPQDNHLHTGRHENLKSRRD
jgi:hypothetical protein